MIEGKIIKFFREKAGLTQDQLGKGICSVTHLSKIELGQTNYSHEMIMFLSKRLDINIEKKIQIFDAIKQKLLQGHEAIIRQKFQEIDRIMCDLKQNELIDISDYQISYQLLHARYHLLKEQPAEALKVLTIIQQQSRHLSPFEDRLLKHLLGIYYLKRQEFQKAIHTLQTIDTDRYNDPEYYYHIAIAYHSNNAKLTAYSYALEALHYFKKTTNFLRVIDTEMLILILKDSDINQNFKERIKKYDVLIQSCELCQAPTKKAKVLHNLAFEYYLRKDYENASKHYLKAMNLKGKGSNKYLASLEGYLQCTITGRLLPDDELLDLVVEGLASAENLNNPLYVHLFTLQLYLVKHQAEKYYQYLHEQALPFFKLYGHASLIRRSEKELFNYYSLSGKTDSALKIAHILINS